MQIRIPWPVCCALLCWVSGCTDVASPAPAEPGSAKPAQLSTLLGATDDAGYARAVEPRKFTFPADHGPHPDFRNEWWYWTGNLRAADGRAFGYQFTIFRFALVPSTASSPAGPARTSAWATRDSWLAHLTLTDIAGQRFYAFERSGRGALDLAGATAEPFRVHCDGWEASRTRLDGIRIHADTPHLALDLTLAPGKPLVLQGERGLSRKGAEPGNASYYYSQTRMPTGGTIRLSAGLHAGQPDELLHVTGTSWMDREWSTSALAPGVVGWDWFALQLSDGRDLMFYRLRRADGSATGFSGGALIAVDGTLTPLAPDQVSITPQGTWTSRSGVVYPAGWRLHSTDFELVITPALADQELDLTVRYWEGAVGVTGSMRGVGPTTGVGYVELAGYP